ncbi:MFS transporter [Candidatus Albibeggiatoa sp. nov. NOAA]|uniref:MFS transporter n=1 Tax=Candidatus Albibeggiatoa sp. nov. NOAA TaxID=3162724 RepID=UPI0032FAD422|nr:MFS transporter [Thiotrichaceae bacterium]
MNGIPYWRLSNFYFFYFASLGALMPFWGLYLQNIGFNSQQIGELVAILLVTKLIAPNIWGWLADASGKHLVWVRWGSLLAFVSFAGLILDKSYWWYVFIIALFSFFWNAVLPLIEATTFAYLGDNAKRYSHIRLWGSVGFVVAVIAFGLFFETFSILWLPYLSLALFTGIWLTSLVIPEKVTHVAHQAPASLSQILFRPEVIALFVVCLLLQMSHSPYYTFYSIYLENHGYSRNVIGWMWALGVIAEVGLFAISYWLLKYFSLAHLLTVTCVLTAFRWWLIANFVDSFPILIIAQLFHAISFGLGHAVAIHLIHQYFTGNLKGRGQALYSSISFGAGGAIGSYLSGHAWDSLGALWTYYAAVAVCLAAALISLIWIRDKHIQDFRI